MNDLATVAAQVVNLGHEIHSQARTYTELTAKVEALGEDLDEIRQQYDAAAGRKPGPKTLSDEGKAGVPKPTPPVKTTNAPDKPANTEPPAPPPGTKVVTNAGKCTE